jgi:clathrin coat assembly protein (fragment)
MQNYPLDLQIDCGIKLSGTPDLSLSFYDSRIFDDVSFHPCVRYRKWELEKVLSFIPPDGNFRLMSYHIGAQNVITVPIFVKSLIVFKELGAGKFELSISPRQTIGRTVR